MISIMVHMLNVRDQSQLLFDLEFLVEILWLKESTAGLRVHVTG
jgi:hypothetical protein